MRLTSILCPLDFSAASAAVVAYAAALAAGTGAELRLLHVCEPDEPPAEAGTAAPSAGSCAERMASLHAAATQAGALHVQSRLVRGEAAAAIVAEATRRPTDLIVIGAHGQTGLSRFLMGNTAEVVLRTAPCPTLLVREGMGN